MFLKKGKSRRILLKILIYRAAEFGLPDKDIQHAQEFLKYNEPLLCIDLIATQLYEFEITIDAEFYEIVLTLLELMTMPKTFHEYLKELIPNNNC